MESFKKYLTEGREPWMKVSLNKGFDRWSFKNLETEQRNYIKVNPSQVLVSIQRFLEEIEAKPGNEKTKTKGHINYEQFAHNIINGKSYNFYIKKSMLEKIKKTWII